MDKPPITTDEKAGGTASYLQQTKRLPQSQAATRTDRVPPNDTKAEAGALGCVLCAGNGETEMLLDQLDESLFYDIRHIEVFRNLIGLQFDHLPIDLVSLIHRLTDGKLLGLAGGNEYVLRLPDQTPSSAHFPSFLNILKDRAARRKMITDADRARAKALDLSVPVAPPGKLLKPLAIWSPAQFLAWIEPVGSQLLLPAYLTKGELTAFIGQPGVGKTRLALWLAIAQILAWEWCGLQTAGEPQTWLFLSDENSIARFKADLQSIFQNLKPEQINIVGDYLRLQALIDTEDSCLWLGDITTRDRVCATLDDIKPGVVVIDPLANFAPEDVAKPAEMREAVRLIQSLIRRSVPKASTLALHHARPGRQNVIQGVGWDALNFASGGKALVGMARCQINLMPGKADDDTRLVLSCGKANNCEKFKTRGLVFNRDTFTYAVDDTFDADVWQADLEGRTRKTSGLATLRDVIECVQGGRIRTSEIVEALMTDCLVSKRTAESLIEKTRERGGIKRITRGTWMLGSKYEKLLESIA